MLVEDFSDIKFDQFDSNLTNKEDSAVRVPDIGSGNNSNTLTLYHGTKEINFKQDWEKNNPNNDYGSGLYLTPELDKGLEWAMSSYHGEGDGYVFEYRFDTTGLNILHLNRKDIIEWIVILLQNREFKSITGRAYDRIQELLRMYPVDISGYDVIYGYRADDSYFRYVTDFLRDELNTGGLKVALESGKLGMQYCLKSKDAFDHLEFVKRYKATNKDLTRFLNREKSANDNIARMDNNVKYSGKSIRHLIGET